MNDDMISNDSHEDDLTTAENLDSTNNSDNASDENQKECTIADNNSNKFKKSFKLSNKNFSVETGVLSKQADASILVTHGETVVLCTLSVAKERSEKIDFLPLTVNYVVKDYAFNRIRGGYIKREGKLSDQEILITRMIDRSIRPLIKNFFHQEMHLTCSLLSHDNETNPDIGATAGAILLLMMAKIPLKENVAGLLRICCMSDEKLIVNPNNSESEKVISELLITAAPNSIIMLENCGNEIKEEKILEMIEYGFNEMKTLQDFMSDFVTSLHQKEESNDDGSFEILPELSIDSEILSTVEKHLHNIFSNKSKKKINFLVYQLLQSVIRDFSAKYNENHELIKSQFHLAIKKVVNDSVLEKNLRIDGRQLDEIRSIDCEAGLLPKVNGSAIFTRGSTQVMSIVTIGAENDGQIVENINGVNDEVMKEKFMIHYNFPPYATGDSYTLRLSPGRREIGHGNLAQKSFYAVLPEKDSFSYTVRIVAEVLESDGSSSMATVCSSSISLKHAGIPIKKIVAGIAMGCFANDNKKIVVSDISGIEDQCGSMDCKVAGTMEGITAMQMDTKKLNIDIALMRQILTQAHEGRISILQKIIAKTDVLSTSLNKNVPIQSTMMIDRNSIKYVIGSGGKNIKEICTLTNARISISQEGKISISASKQSMIDDVKNIVNQIISRPVIGKKYKCKVSYITRMGVFVEFLFKRKGLLRTNTPDDYSEGMELEAILSDINGDGKCYFHIEGDENSANNNTGAHDRKKYNNPNSYYYDKDRDDQGNRNGSRGSFNNDDRRKKTPRFF